MAHPHDFNQVQIIGDAYDGAEIWTTGFSMGATEQAAVDPTIEAAEYIATQWATFFTTLTSGFSNEYRTLAVKYNKIDAVTSRQATDPTIEYVYPSPVVGVGSNQMPPQCTVVLSLRAEQSRGLATKGRMYLPITGLQIGTAGTIAGGSVTNVLTNAATFFNSLRNNAAAPGVPILTSGAGSIVGASNGVAQIAVGNMYDTQRRRRNQMQEAYQVADIGL